MEEIFLYHTGFQEIREPDVHYGRKNADFGQGFYLTADRDFAERWAKERRGSSTYLNTYVFRPEGLSVIRLERGADWFDYIYANRRGETDRFPEADVITGPIANDTIYDVMGITTSGFLSKEESLHLLDTGPVYTQIALKTEKAVSHLAWQEARIITPEEIKGFQKELRREEEEFQVLFVKKINEL